MALQNVTIQAKISGKRNLLISCKEVFNNKEPPYCRIGGQMEFKTGVQGYDEFLKILEDLPKVATWFWWRLCRLSNTKTNITRYSAASHLEAKKITCAYQELVKHNLVLRISKETYLINPTAFLPHSGYYPSVKDTWDMWQEKLNPNPQPKEPDPPC